MSEPNVTLRSATPADVPAMVALLEAAHLPAMELEDHLQNFVAADDGTRVVGCGGLEAYPDCAAGLVRSMVVNDSLQKTGLGALILEWVLDRARELGHRQAFLFTMGAGPFYERFGFREVTLDEFPPCARVSGQYRVVSQHGKEWGIIAMIKELDDNRSP